MLTRIVTALLKNHLCNAKNNELKFETKSKEKCSKGKALSNCYLEQQAKLIKLESTRPN